jgi:hypothetical protein
MTVSPDHFVGDALFCDQVYDCTATHFPEPIDSPEVVLHFLSSGFERTGASGVCFRLVPTQVECGLPYPYGIAVVTLNPFKLRLKALRLTELVKRGLRRETDDYRRELLDAVFSVSIDTDIATFKPVFINHADLEGDEIPYALVDPDRSLRELADQDLNSHDLVFSSVVDALIEQSGNGAEMNSSGLEDCLSPSSGTAQFNERNIASVRYFGLLHDIMARCAEYVWKHDPDFTVKSAAEVYESSLLFLKMFGMRPLRTGETNSK